MIEKTIATGRAVVGGLLLIASCAPVLIGCNDQEPGASTGAGPQASGPAAPLYAVFTQVETDESEVSYLALTDSLENQSELDLENALEASDGSRFYAPETGGFFAIGSGEDLTITRYDVGENRRFVTAGKVSFQGAGVTRLQHRNVFASATKAYYIDNTQGQIIIWNPATMSIEKSIKLPPEATEGFQGFRVIYPYYTFPFVQGKIFIPVSWLNTDQGKTRPLTGLVVFDTATDAVTYSETDRCPAATELAFGAGGDVYFGTNVNQPFYENAQDPAKRATARTSCILRITAGQTQFDPSYILKIADITGGRVGMSLANAASPGLGYVQVLDESVAPWSAITDEDKYWESAAWEWWLVDLKNRTASVDKGLPAGTPFIKTFEVDTRRYVVQQRDDDKSQIFLLSPDGAHKPGLTATGAIEGIARVR